MGVGPEQNNRPILMIKYSVSNWSEKKKYDIMQKVLFISFNINPLSSICSRNPTNYIQFSSTRRVRAYSKHYNIHAARFCIRN